MHELGLASKFKVGQTLLDNLGDTLELEGIGVVRLEQLLESATRMTLEEKQSFLNDLGFRVARTSHSIMTDGLIRAGFDKAFDAICKLWWHQLASDARSILEAVRSGGPRPLRQRQSRGLMPLFHANGGFTVLGTAILRWLKVRDAESDLVQPKLSPQQAFVENPSAVKLDAEPEKATASEGRGAKLGVPAAEIRRVLNEINRCSPLEFEFLTANLARLVLTDDPDKVKVMGRTGTAALT
jgi:hypothetical protein